MIARNRVFVVPVCLDATPEAAADVPESFQRVQWTRLPAGETPPAFVERVRRLLSTEPPITFRPPASAASGAGPPLKEPVPPFWRSRPILLAIVAVVVLAAPAYFWISKHLTPSAATFVPPPHSIAVLPFVNMSGDKEQDYFSDGLSEELLNDLARINELQVAARTSAFSFKGKDTDIGTIARRLNVGAVLEGSVRRSAHTVRVTAQLINAVTGFHIWSQTYDRDVDDILKLQTEIADAVARALKVTLLGNVAAKVELGGTSNPAAFDAYLRGAKSQSGGHDAKEVQAVINAFTDAISLDPNYALAYAARSAAVNEYAGYWTSGAAAVHEGVEKALADGRKAILLAPELGEGHRALAQAFESLLDFRGGLAKLKMWMGEGEAAQYAEIYAQWGDKESALQWLETAWRLRDSGLGYLKVDPLLDPLRKEPRFQAIERELKFPQ
jgi:TolB-like protein